TRQIVSRLLSLHCVGAKSRSERESPELGIIQNRIARQHRTRTSNSIDSGGGIMIDVHVITNTNRHLYERELDDHHRIRHHIYIEELKWKGLTPRSDGREYDQFDFDATVYLLGLEEGRVVG